MYSKYADQMGWKVDVSASEGEHGGYKEIARVIGDGVYSRMKFSLALTGAASACRIRGAFIPCLHRGIMAEAEDLGDIEIDEDLHVPTVLPGRAVSTLTPPTPRYGLPLPTGGGGVPGRA